MTNPIDPTNKFYVAAQGHEIVTALACPVPTCGQWVMREALLEHVSRRHKWSELQWLKYLAKQTRVVSGVEQAQGRDDV